MNTSLFPTAYFAPISYFIYYLHAEKPKIDVFEHFIKQSIRTRCEILGHNGKQLLSIPVERPFGNKTPIKDVRIIDNGWQNIHWKTLQTAYASSPFFEHYSSEIHNLLFLQEQSLIDFNEQIFQRVLTWIGINKKSVFTHEYVVHPTIDHRNTRFDTSATWKHEAYTQVFRQQHECLFNLSILDLICNQGPMARTLLFNKKPF